MTWFHLVINGFHVVFPLSSIAYMYSGAIDGTQVIFLVLIDGTTYNLTTAQATKIVGTIPAAL